MSYRRAKKRLMFRARIANVLDTVMTEFASHLHMCGEGKKNNWSILFAQIFYTECPCCNFFRGVSVGFVTALALCGLLALAVALIF